MVAMKVFTDNDIEEKQWRAWSYDHGFDKSIILVPWTQSFDKVPMYIVEKSTEWEDANFLLHALRSLSFFDIFRIESGSSGKTGIKYMQNTDCLYYYYFRWLYIFF
jgi:hypothetical protein